MWQLKASGKAQGLAISTSVHQFLIELETTMTLPPQPGVLQTPGFSHYSIAWSPFHTTRLALASAANFGLVGNGRLHIVSVNPTPGGPSRLNIDKQCEHILPSSTT